MPLLYVKKKNTQLTLKMKVTEYKLVPGKYGTFPLQLYELYIYDLDYFFYYFYLYSHM